MSKKVAVLAVNPVNGSGLFQYLKPSLKKESLTKYLQFPIRKPSGPIQVSPWKQTIS